MSMLSAQCDELRAMAASVGLEVPQAATLMMEAADTILSLRDRAQDLQAENAKLREERDNYKALWEHATITDCELRRVRAAWKEDREQNAKLRELVRGLVYATHPADRARLIADAAELGVEVDG